MFQKQRLELDPWLASGWIFGVHFGVHPAASRHPSPARITPLTLRFCPEQIEQWPLARLKPYARNPRTHADDQVAKLAASLVEFGWTVPVLVDDAGEVIAGHGRILAAIKLGLKEVPKMTT